MRDAMEEVVFLSSLVNWHTVAFSLLANFVGYLVSPYILCRVWKDYNRVKEKAKTHCDFNMRPVTATCGVVSIVLAGKAFFYEKDVEKLQLVGSTPTGIFALDVVLGQFLAEFVYQLWMLGYPGSTRNFLHHLSGIVGSVLSHHYWHKFALYRFTHEVTLPVIMVFAQMHMVEYNTNSTWYKIVARINLFTYFLFRIVVIPFHWLWFSYVIISSQSEWSDVWIAAWPVLFLCHAAVDYVDCYWGCQLMRIYQDLSKSWKGKKEH